MMDKKNRLKTIRIAMIGCGAVAQLYYLPALGALERQGILQVVALVDPNPDATEYLRRSFPKAYSAQEVDDVLKLGIDLAIVAVPPRYHATQTIRLLQQGIAVLCEKPMATTVSEGEAMIRAAVETQTLLAIGLFRRFLPATQTIQQILRQNVLGKIRRVSCYEGGVFRWPVQSKAFFQKEAAGGGVLQDIGVHLLDLLICWFGEPTERSYEDDAMGGVEANCRLTLRFDDDIRCDVRLSRDWERPNCYYFEGSKAWLRWQVDNPESVEMGFGAGQAIKGSVYNAVNDTRHQEAHPALGQPCLNFEQSFIHQLQNVIEAIHGCETLRVPGEEGLRSLKLIEDCYRNRQWMPMPWLSSAEAQRAKELAGFQP